MKKVLTGDELYHTVHTQSEEGDIILLGVTIRQQFAAMAMQGLLASSDFPGLRTANEYAKHAVKMADALIEALNPE